jgi:hypothetical protein
MRGWRESGYLNSAFSAFAAQGPSDTQTHSLSAITPGLVHSVDSEEKEHGDTVFDDESDGEVEDETCLL